MTDADWPEPYGYALFCDDIRQEVDGKVSLIGQYGYDILVPEFPLMLPLFCLMARFFEKPEDSSIALELQVFFPGDADDSPTARFPVAPRGEPPPLPEFKIKSEFSPRIGLNFALKFASIVLKEEGHIKARLVRGDVSYRLGALRVIRKPADHPPTT